jgi:hypothetical protein
MLAAMNTQEAAVRTLLEAGADLTLRDQVLIVLHRC